MQVDKGPNSPMINVSSNNWGEEADFLVFYLFDPLIRTKNKEVFDFYVNQKAFCDCKGDLYRVVDRVHPTNKWRRFFWFLPGVYRMPLVLKKLDHPMDLEEFRRFMLKRISELGLEDFIREWSNEVRLAKSHKEIIDPISTDHS